MFVTYCCKNYMKIRIFFSQDFTLVIFSVTFIFKSAKLIFTGGLDPLNSTLPPEGDIYIKEAISMGIPKKDLFTTHPVFNTLGEAKAIILFYGSLVHFI